MCGSSMKDCPASRSTFISKRTSLLRVDRLNQENLFIMSAGSNLLFLSFSGHKRLLVYDHRLMPDEAKETDVGRWSYQCWCELDSYFLFEKENKTGNRGRSYFLSLCCLTFSFLPAKIWNLLWLEGWILKRKSFVTVGKTWLIILFFSFYISQALLMDVYI